MRCKSILIIEDNDDIRETLEVMLRDEGYRVFAVSNGRDGIAALKRIPGPCLILLDLMMPIMNGWEFLKEQQENDIRLEECPVIVVTALGVSSALIEKEHPLPAVGYVRKPFDMDRLLEMVAEYSDKVPESVSLTTAIKPTDALSVNRNEANENLGR